MDLWSRDPGVVTGGADPLATVIVIDEIARACAATSLISALNKLASVPWLLAGSEDLR
jgi:alkylation response protein AidB-like acyl-CoA dehydrogenase